MVGVGISRVIPDAALVGLALGFAQSQKIFIQERLDIDGLSLVAPRIGGIISFLAPGHVFRESREFLRKARQHEVTVVKPVAVGVIH